MATSRIIGRIVTMAVDNSNPPDAVFFIVDYIVLGDVAGEISGQLVVSIDSSQNETQMTHDIKLAIAALIEPLITPTQGYILSDVRGCAF